MNDFVEQCRLEWGRLGVPDPLAQEMAADLAADLKEAEAEGVSLDDVVGPDASDPRSFAAHWAAERGIIPEPSGPGNTHRKPLALVTFTALAALALVVSALLLATGEPKVALKTSAATPPPLPVPPSARYLPPGHLVQASAAAPVEWILLFLATAALGFTTWLWLRWDRSHAPNAAA